MKENNIIKDKSFEFAIEIIKIYKFLTEEKREYILSKQLVRSGTSIGANIREGINAESKPDFIHKLAIAQKEADETLYWLELLNKTNYIDDSIYENLNKKCIELIKILKAIITTMKERYLRKN
ncbi:MAG: four helix bundle protein [Ignavibacteriae bacterium]|nr:four helix bundle protein [Ignavibacteriota bacterium]